MGDSASAVGKNLVASGVKEIEMKRFSRGLHSIDAVPRKFLSQNSIGRLHSNVDALSEAIVGTEPNDAWPEVERIFRTHYTRLARVIARVIRDPARAEELAVEVCLKWSVSRKAEGEKAERWLYRAAVQTGLNELRQEMRRSRYERLVSFVRRSQTPEELLLDRQQQERVRLLLTAVEPREAELLVLRSQGFSYEELAATLNLNPASVGTLLGRAQQAFRKEYTRRYGTRRFESK